VPQDPYKILNPWETMRSQLERVCKRYGKWSLEEIWQEVALPQNTLELFPHALSAGQRQRAIFAHALAVSPELLILDEPTASVDSQGRAVLLQCFANMARRGHTLLIISHETEEYNSLIASQNRFDFSHTRKNYTMTEKKAKAVAEKPILSLTGIRKGFNGFSVLENVDWAIGLNEWVYLEGHNGCGKTTLLHIILGLLKPEGGSLQWLGKTIPCREIWTHSARHIHVVFQDAFHSLNPRIPIETSLREVLSSIPAAHRSHIQEQEKELWHELELKDELRKMLPRDLSYGQQKRVVLLRTLLKYYGQTRINPDSAHLLLLDEVFSGIHWQLRNKIIALLQKMRETKPFSIIWVAHGHQVLKEICDSAYRLREGRITKI
jgi:ABC-type dipeptide/oligopeptide/nickel transport system ATPase subunit